MFQLCILRPSVSSARLQINHVANVFGPQVSTFEMIMYFVGLILYINSFVRILL